ncbi:MAG: UDP-glucose 6-dehydrogenase [Candidatus Buchananbacteria bacterium CG10_big_fil_rev_8_21_14_0_10_42_9]|uniref:UDP-glucose 6-dehydrogenase n=1 Tax=Candidatus Buchananbacteria bacterium CG10_big_fil_rev_8_21_14_0_10_42_9 TaxID=1974526 RepID=A0A2H0W1B4_9BACT|nr:MAG: UDP-glucose 6-dehydrogenase [Candidatus Buchananbacteria bacterium CG10_big_fil_rev_8_21_14_0_10_42_9]
MKAAIIGTGYVGLTTGVCLAHIGHDIICVDNNPEKIKLLQSGTSPIFEPHLEDLLKENMAKRKISFSDSIKKAVLDSDVVFVCVNTPPKKDGHPDLKYVEQVTKEIAEALKTKHGFKVIVDKSTVPVKTAEKVSDTIKKYTNGNGNVAVVSNPEFLREGQAMHDTFYPDRIVIGSDSDRATEIMLKLYAPIIEKSKPGVRITSVKSAELIKHGANSFLATKISFANLIAEIAEASGADALEILEAIGLDERIGKQFLNPGIGYGGSCFPKDVAAFKKTLEMFDIDSSLLASVEKINDDAIKNFVKKIEKELWVLDGKQIGVLGVAFKPNTDDIRNSPALKIIKRLQQDGSQVTAYDPQAMDNAKKENPDIKFVNNPYDVAKGADAILICTEWGEFKKLDLAKVKSLMNTPIIFDGRNLFDPQDMAELGFKYFGIGR